MLVFRGDCRQRTVRVMIDKQIMIHRHDATKPTLIFLGFLRRQVMIGLKFFELRGIVQLVEFNLTIGLRAVEVPKLF